MPNHNTFTIKPIKEFIEKHITDGVWLDPFSRNSPFRDICITNDLNPDILADYHMEALEFLKLFDDASVDGVLFDPPYSPRQISECYKQVGIEVHTKDTQSSFYGDRKKKKNRLLESLNPVEKYYALVGILEELVKTTVFCCMKFYYVLMEEHIMTLFV